MFNKLEQQSIVDALKLSGIEYTDIQFFQNGRVSIYQEIENEETIFLAECGIFTPLKKDAVTIWDTLGTTLNDNDEDIEFFIVYIENKAYAKYTIFPNMVRTVYNSVAHERKQTNWDTSRSELLLETGIKIEEVKIENVEQVKEIVIVAVKLHFVGKDERQAARKFMKDLLSLIKIKEKVNETRNYRSPEASTKQTVKECN